MNVQSCYSVVMKLMENSSEKQSMNYDEESLVKRVAGLKPRFASNAEAHTYYLAELELLAAKNSKTIDQLVKDADSSKEWTPEVQKVLRLSRLVSTLSRP